MKISGTSGNVTFDYENGYVLKAEGELLTDVALLYIGKAYRIGNHLTITFLSHRTR